MRQQILICSTLDSSCRNAKTLWPKWPHWFRTEELCLCLFWLSRISLTFPSPKKKKIYQSADWGVEWMLQEVWSTGQQHWGASSLCFTVKSCSQLPASPLRQPRLWMHGNRMTLLGHLWKATSPWTRVRQNQPFILPRRGEAGHIQ